MAGAEKVARHFPFVIGRAPQADLRLEEDGVWDRHICLDMDPQQRISLSVQSDASALVNGEAVQSHFLRNGDLIDLGGARIRFGFSAVQQRSLRLREALTWLGLAGLCLGQIALIYWLLGY